MFKNGLDEALLKWLKKEAGKDWVEPSRLTEWTDFGRVQVFWGWISVSLMPKKLRLTWKPNPSAYFESEAYTRARFRKALRKLKGGK